tara:strand:+ start:2787 stop:2894 length:108 start_codon:yes stop_codon:yes gene_type:complete
MGIRIELRALPKSFRSIPLNPISAKKKFVEDAIYY